MGSRQHVDGQLRLSLDRKTAPRGIWQQSRRRWTAQDPNSFGLPAGTSCPGKTRFCESCYAGRAENQAGVHDLVDYNLALLLDAGTVDAMAELLANMIGRYRTHNDRIRLPAEDWVFRIHWDGDFFSTDYARAWARVIRANPDVTFWAYTRSFTPAVNVVPILDRIPNLALYLSIDEQNAAAGHHVLAAHPGVLAAFCARDYRRARALIPPNRPSALRCPENAGRMPLMADGRGACITCAVCTTGRRDILFASSHSEDAAVPVFIARQTGPTGDQPAETYPCGNPDCDTIITRRAGPGRPKICCSRACQVRRLYLINQETAHAP